MNHRSCMYDGHGTCMMVMDHGHRSCMYDGHGSCMQHTFSSS